MEIVETYINRSAVDFEKSIMTFQMLLVGSVLSLHCFGLQWLMVCYRYAGHWQLKWQPCRRPCKALRGNTLPCNCNWLEKTIEEGTAAGELAATGTPRQKAFQILSLLEGSSFVRWAMNDGTDLEPAAIGAIVFH